MWNIKAFQTKELFQFNEMLGNHSWHCVMVLDRGGTYTLAVFSTQLQVLGFPQVLVGAGYCSPLKGFKQEIAMALKGVKLLAENNLTLEILREHVRTDLGLHPTGYRSDSELVEVFWTLCRRVGNGDISIEDAKAFFVQRWTKMLSNKLTDYE